MKIRNKVFFLHIVPIQPGTLFIAHLIAHGWQGAFISYANKEVQTLN